MTNRLILEEHLGPGDRRRLLENDARAGLGFDPKCLSPVWFYDERGSELFDEITRLPEYYPTRCERALLEAHAPEIVARCGADTLVELGSGTSTKTRVVLDAFGGRPCRYVSLDVDPDTLFAAAKTLVDEYPALTVHAVAGDFSRHVSLLPRDGCRLVAFLGGTIGNLRSHERVRFLRTICETLGPGDHLLLGVDLVKDPARLVAAYDDAAGVTAEFNRNALRVLNRELDGDVDVDAFDHVALWNAEEEWIEMRLRARRATSARLAALDLDVRFAEGEEVLTEISAKFTDARVEAELWEAGFRVADRWRHGADDFLLVLAEVATAG